MIVAHDPGHGPKAGTCHNGIVERDYVLELAKDLAAGLPGWGLRHVLLRTSNEGEGCLPYAARGKAALEAQVQLVLCHHVNAFAGPQRARGLITFYDPLDVVGREVATAIARAAPAELYRERRGVIGTSPAETWDDRAEMVLGTYRRLGLPAVLIEWGFATDPDDAAALLAPKVRPAMVAAAGVGLARALTLLHPDMVI